MKLYEQIREVHEREQLSVRELARRFHVHRRDAPGVGLGQRCGVTRWFVQESITPTKVHPERGGRRSDPLSPAFISQVPPAPWWAQERRTGADPRGTRATRESGRRRARGGWGGAVEGADRRDRRGDVIGARGPQLGPGPRG